MIRRGRAGIRRRKRDEDVSRTVAGNASVPSEPKRNAPRQPLQLMRHERRIRRHDNDDGSVVLIRKRRRRVRIFALDFPADRNSRDAQILPRAVVALNQYANRVLPAFRCEPPRRCANASFESVAHHSRAAANCAFRHRARLRGIDGVKRVLRFYVEAVDVVQPSVPGLGHYGKGPPVVIGADFLVRDNPLNHGVADDADAMGVRNHHGADQKTGLLDPGGAGHFAISVQGPPPGHRGVVKVFSTRKNRGNAGTDRAFSDDKLSFAGNQRSVADENAGNIGDCILRAGRVVKRNAKIASTRFCFFLSLREKRDRENTA